MPARQGPAAIPKIVPIYPITFNGVVSVNIVRIDNQNGIDRAPDNVVAVANKNQFNGVGYPRVTDKPSSLK